MTTVFPTGLDSFVNPNAAGGDTLASVPHDAQHSNINDAVKALEAKVGVNGSAVTTSLDYKVAHIVSGVSSVSNSDGSLTISPTTGAVIASLNTNHSNTWAASQAFGTASANTFAGGVFQAGEMYLGMSQLYDPSGNTVISFAGGGFSITSPDNTLLLSGHTLYGPAGKVDVDNGFIWDGSGSTQIQWSGAGVTINPGSNPGINFNVVSVASSTIFNVNGNTNAVTTLNNTLDDGLGTAQFSALKDSSGSTGGTGYIPVNTNGLGNWLWTANNPFVNPMTTLGDTLYENAGPSPARLPGNTTATKKFLTQTGTGAVSAAPAWNTIAASDLPTSSLSVLATATGINGKTVANTSVYTNSSGKTAIITGVTVRCTAASAITVGPAAGLGTSAGTNNVFASAAMSALTGTTNIFGYTLVGMSISVANGSSLFFNLGTAATGTSQTLAVDVVGYAV